MNIDFLIGFYLDKAKEIIENEGLELGEIVTTAPPRERPLAFNDKSRVIRAIKREDGKIDLLVSRDMMKK